MSQVRVGTAEEDTSAKCGIGFVYLLEVYKLRIEVICLKCANPNMFGDGIISDKQLYALALYIESLKPPPNPNKFDEHVRRGQQIFKNEGCLCSHCSVSEFATWHQLKVQRLLVRASC